MNSSAKKNPKMIIMKEINMPTTRGGRRDPTNHQQKNKMYINEICSHVIKDERETKIEVAVCFLGCGFCFFVNFFFLFFDCFFRGLVWYWLGGSLSVSFLSRFVLLVSWWRQRPPGVYSSIIVFLFLLCRL